MTSKEWPPCVICGKSVTTADGILAIKYSEIWQYEKEMDLWEQEHPRDENGNRILAPSDLSSHPLRVRWHWGHINCITDADVYDIGADTFDTIGKALRWTLHLMEKPWILNTNWAATVRRFYDL
ncbi:hypothetical protein ACFLWV_03465 [Chloroflexota bacterium]